MKKACTECNRSGFIHAPVLGKTGAGFTLIELLVVVAIIAILSLIGLTIFSTAQLNARDARRKADIDAIGKAIEINKTPGELYYTQLPKEGFSAGVVPTESFAGYKPQYCIRTSTKEATPGDPTTWVGTGTGATACPTVPAAGTGESAWFDILSTGMPDGTGIPTAQSDFGASILSWKVCARLEASTGDTNTDIATPLKIFCYPSSQ